MWTTTRPATRAAKPAVPRPRVASIAWSSASMRITTSALAKTSAVSVAVSAPAARSGSVRAAVRFQTISGVPERTSRSAMGCPMTRDR